LGVGPLLLPPALRGEVSDQLRLLIDLQERLIDQQEQLIDQQEQLIDEQKQLIDGQALCIDEQEQPIDARPRYRDVGRLIRHLSGLNTEAQRHRGGQGIVDL